MTIEEAKAEARKLRDLYASCAKDRTLHEIGRSAYRTEAEMLRRLLEEITRLESKVEALEDDAREDPR